MGDFTNVDGVYQEAHTPTFSLCLIYPESPKSASEVVIWRGDSIILSIFFDHKGPDTSASSENEMCSNTGRETAETSQAHQRNRTAGYEGILDSACRNVFYHYSFRVDN